MGTDQPERSGEVALRSDAPPQTGDHVPSSAEAAHLDALLTHELSAMTELLMHYTLTIADDDTGPTRTVSVTAELALADTLSAAADAMRARATRRQSQHAADMFASAAAQTTDADSTSAEPGGA
jgi:hypothetical protein